MDKENHTENSLYIQTAASQPSQPDNFADSTGKFNGGHYKIEHHNTNALLWMTLQPNVPFCAQAGAMVTMGPEVAIQRKYDFSFTEVLTGSDSPQTIFTGPGEVLFALPTGGDIVPIQVDGQTRWSINRDGFFGMTAGVIKETRFQGFSNAIYYSENLFVYNISGDGIIFVKSRSAIIQRCLKQDEQWIVSNGHLVAWNCPYSIERVGGIGINSINAVIYKFTGPGTVIIHANKKRLF